MPIANDLFVDTSGWAHYLDRKDPLNAVATSLVNKALNQRRRLVTTNYIITELVVLLTSRYHLPRRQVVTAINTIKTDASVEVIFIERAIDNAAWNLLETRLDKAWSLVDASSFVVMKQLGITEALTSDYHFTQAGFRRMLHT
jgi:predicted nucleic acid-binding protein